MNQEIQLINDGDGVAVIGDSAAVERFLAAAELPSTDLGLPRLGNALAKGSGLAVVGSEVAKGSGRWVKLTEKSAKALQASPAMKGSQPGVSRAVLTKNGRIKEILEFSTSNGDMLANPAVLAGAAGIMAQLAMQQTMDEITDYLAVIDKKVDDILRAQKDAVLADMLGVDLVIKEAMTVRDEVGRVSEVTWSKVQATSMTIARTQAYALRQLDAYAEKMERETKVSDLAERATEAEAKIQEWLAVLAHCFQLQDALGVLELERVLDASPDELDHHRLGLRSARENRRSLISDSTGRLLERMNAAGTLANDKVLLHPMTARSVVDSSNIVSSAVVDFHGILGVANDQEALEAKAWKAAATEATGKVVSKASDGAQAAKRVGAETVGQATSTLDRARSTTTQFSVRIADRFARRRGDTDDD
ncbi:hypothetical protein [Janibacter alittae]|uniref:Uncharacterized protein n=1 Tax=Janibacter alittae TaxID=3115209 RepID=A0ABZ2MGR1_9MICO